MKKNSIKLSEKELIESFQSMKSNPNDDLKSKIKMDLVARYAQPELHFQPSGLELWMGRSILLVLVICLLFVLAQLSWKTMEDFLALVPLLVAGLFWGIVGLKINRLKME